MTAYSKTLPWGGLSFGLAVVGIGLFQLRRPVPVFTGIVLMFAAAIAAWMADRARSAQAAMQPSRAYFFLIALAVAFVLGSLGFSQSVTEAIRHILVIVTRALVAHH